MTETYVDSEKCNGCEVCLQICPVNAIIIENNLAVIQDTCTDCGLCIDVCPEEAIKTQEKEEAEYRGILFFAGVAEGKPDKSALLALEKTTELARELGVYVDAVLAGTKVEEAAEALIAYGANKVIVAKGPDFQKYSTQNLLRILFDIMEARRPEAVVFVDSFAGKDLGSRLAQRLKTTFVTGCTELAVEERERKIVQTRPCFGGKVKMRLVSIVNAPQIFSIRVDQSREPEKADYPRGEVIEWTG